MGSRAKAVIWGSVCLGAVVAAMPSVHAQGKFDGRWSGVLMTRSGPCDAAYRGAVQVTNGVVQIPGVNAVSGQVSPDGAVTVTGSLGENHGVASGRLSGNSGHGTWRARLQNKDCSGVWSAQRE